jgi:hypothetical protein
MRLPTKNQLQKMKAKVTIYWVTTEFHNSGTETEVYASERDQHARFQSIMEERLENRPSYWSASETAAADEVQRLITASDIPAAWEAFRESTDDGTTVQHGDDCFRWGEEELEIEIKDQP